MTHVLLSVLISVSLAAAGTDKVSETCRQAERLIVTGKGEEARALLAKAGAAPGDARVVVLTARSYLAYPPTDVDAAMNVLKPFLKANPRNPDALLEWARALRDVRNYADAVKTYDIVIKYAPQELRAYYGKVDTLIIQGKFKDAEAAARAAVAIDANRAESVYYLGKVFERRTDLAGARETAVTHFQRAVELGGADTRFYGPLLFAQLMYAAGDFRGTLDRLRQQSPGDASVAFGDGLLLDGQGKLPEALAKFQGAVSVDPSHTYAQFALGTLYTGHSLGALFRGTGGGRRERRAVIANPNAAYSAYATVRLQDPTFPYMYVIDDFQGRMQSQVAPVMSPEIKDQQKSWQKYWLLLQLRH